MNESSLKKANRIASTIHTLETEKESALVTLDSLIALTGKDDIGISFRMHDIKSGDYLTKEHYGKICINKLSEWVKFGIDEIENKIKSLRSEFEKL